MTKEKSDYSKIMIGEKNKHTRSKISQTLRKTDRINDFFFK